MDYGARHYGPFLGSWTTPDPMAEKYYGWSPYAFCADDPMIYYDIIGMENTIFGAGTIIRVIVLALPLTMYLP